MTFSDVTVLLTFVSVSQPVENAHGHIILMVLRNVVISVTHLGWVPYQASCSLIIVWSSSETERLV